MIRNISRRLERLEARVRPTIVSFTIHFIHPKKGLTRILRIESGQHVWMKPAGVKDCQPTTGVAN